MYGTVSVVVEQVSTAARIRGRRWVGALLGAVRVLTKIEQLSVPWVSIIIRRAFGMAGGMHAPKYFPSLNHRFAWPSARWGSIPIEGGVAAAYRKEIESATDPVAKRLQLEEEYLRMGSPFRTAEQFGILDIIDPRETRAVLFDWMEDAWEVLHSNFSAARGRLSNRAAADCAPESAKSAE